MKRLKNLILVALVFFVGLGFTACKNDNSGNGGTQKQSYTITYQDTKGLSNENPATYTEDAETIILKDLEDTDDYEFLGWYNGETKVTEITKSSKGNLTLTAKWSKKILIIYENSVVGVTSAGKVATKIEIPNGVTSILDNAFSYCTVLKEVIIPDSVTNIGQGAFIGCSSLEEITLPFVGESETKNTFLGYIFGTNYYYKNPDYVPKSLKKVTITKATSIGWYAFYGSSLTSITIPNSVTNIGWYAFSDCRSLTNVTFEDTNGWTVANDWDETHSLSSEELSDVSIAAKCLTLVYYNYNWKKV